MWRESMAERRVGNAVVRVLRGDITEERVDAIVNAANSSLLGGGGVDGAIHRRGGPEILEACRELRRTAFPAGLPPGQAVATGGGLLPARWVIHTVGPVWRGGESGEPELLRSAYLSSLARAGEIGARSVSFPSISTGAYSYPIGDAAPLALATIIEYMQGEPGALEQVRVVAFSESDAEVYRGALQGLGG
jgi:O-acetyl-ADP-ribose deacetylase